MARKVWFQLVDAATRGAYANTQAASVPSDRVSDIDDLLNTVWDQVKAILPSRMIAANLRVYASRAAYDDENAQPLEPRSLLNDLDAQALLIVEVPTQHLAPHAVASVDVAAVANKKPRLEWGSTRWGTHVYNPESRSFLLEKEDMVESGLPPVRLMLYCRPTFHAQFKFMREKVLDGGHLGWILGPPGSGKSTTAVAFASTVNRSEWIVTWIHVENIMDLDCVRLVGEERKTRITTVAGVDEVLQVDDSKKHLLLVDGWTAADSFIDLTAKCHRWLRGDPGKRRLAFVCSVASRGKIHEGTDIRMRAMEFNVWSWTLDEYHTAIEDDEVWRNVAPRLDAATVLPGEEMSRAAMVDAKYHYAGGSCRHMFGFDTVTVMENLSRAVDSLDDAATLATSGQRSSSSINRLHAMFKRPSGVGAVSPVISQYAATLIATRCGSEAIKKFMSTHRDSSNPALDGWMLEMVFFASLRKGGLALVDATGTEVDWGESVVVTADDVPGLSSAHPVWIKPEKWNQGGYDAIMVCKRTQYVRFVQVTSAHKHSFRIEYFYGWLKMLSESESQSFEVKTLEIFFVVEKDKLSTFQISRVTGSGLLHEFGWAKGKEAEQVRLVGMSELYNLSQ
jgi:hypothetical protein